MAILASDPCVDTSFSSPYDDDTPANFARLLDYTAMMARRYAARTGHPYDDYVDHATHLMTLTLARYDPASGVSLLACMWSSVKRNMYEAPSTRPVITHILGRHEKPHAHALRPVRDQPDPWLYVHLARHWDCLTPTLQQTVRDYLADEALEAIATRDGIAMDQVRARRSQLIAWFRRHVYTRETSCVEEQSGAVNRMRDRPSATNRPSRRHAPWVKTFHADRLRQCMKETGKHSGVLRQLLRVDQSQITRWANGKYNPPLHHVEAMARIFDKPVEYFTGAREESPAVVASLAAAD